MHHTKYYKLKLAFIIINKNITFLDAVYPQTDVLIHIKFIILQYNQIVLQLKIS